MRVRGSVIGALVATMALSVPGLGLATPFTGPGKTGPLHWRDGSTINVYIPAGPRFDQLKAGVEAWNSDPSLQAKGVRIEVKQGTAPADPSNPSRPAPGNVSLNLRPGNAPPGADDGTGTANTLAAQIVSGSIDIYEGELNTASFAKKIATHEMGHVLGLDDSKLAGAVMLHDIVDNGTGISADDAAELVSAYLATPADSQIDLSVNVDKVGDYWRYDYDATWLSGASLAVFQVLLGGNAQVISAEAPEGWMIDDYSVPSHVTLNLEGPSRPIFGFILADEISYLGPDHPSLRFSLVADRGPGAGRAFLNGMVSTVAPAPEPGTWALLILGFGLTGAAMRGRRDLKGKGWSRP